MKSLVRNINTQPSQMTAEFSAYRMGKKKGEKPTSRHRPNSQKSEVCRFWLYTRRAQVMWLLMFHVFHFSCATHNRLLGFDSTIYEYDFMIHFYDKRVMCDTRHIVCYDLLMCCCLILPII